MLTENAVALKEWAAVCLALAEGRQSLLLRKGGIAEGTQGFRMEHEEFWLFPTQFHQTPDQLSPEDPGLLGRARSLAPPQGRLSIDLYAVVKCVAFIQDERRLSELEGRHVLAADVVSQRFHYRRPGLFVAAVEVHRRPSPAELADELRFAGCHSWVEFSQAIPTSGLLCLTPSAVLSSAMKVVESLGN